jgi:hypothetical protein
MGAIVAAGAGRAGNRGVCRPPRVASADPHTVFTICCQKIGEKGQHYASVS